MRPARKRYILSRFVNCKLYMNQTISELNQTIKELKEQLNCKCDTFVNITSLTQL